MMTKGPTGFRRNGAGSGRKWRLKRLSVAKIVFRCGILFLFLFLVSKAAVNAGDAAPVKEEEGKNLSIGSVVQSPDEPEGKQEKPKGQPAKGVAAQSSGAKAKTEKTEKTGKKAEAGEEWMLMLVNGENPLPDDYLPPLEKLKNGLQFDARAIGQLEAMLAGAREQGLSPVVCSAYRNNDYQRKLFDRQIKKQISRGWNRRQAEEEARRVVSVPGTSEHNLGLAADIVSESYQILDEKQEETPEMQWLLEHCSEYGFILRYPNGKSDVTGVIYEPWHFRYVGKQAAKEITENGLCLEEYLEELK